MKVNDQRHNLAVSPHGKKSGSYSIGDWVVHRALEKKNNIVSLPGFELSTAHPVFCSLHRLRYPGSMKVS